MNTESDITILDSEDVFDRVFTGSFGRYMLDDSIEVNYLLASLRLRDLEKLQTAADAFDFNDVDFEEMMQRDIDYERVQDEIVEGYLKDSRNKVVFFPPIIVSLVPISEQGRPMRAPLERDDGFRDRASGKFAYVEWGGKKFELEMPVVQSNTGYSMRIKNDNINFVNYATRLRVNSEEVKLVVIDGQHRFVALQQLIKTNREVVKHLELPVCFVFSPNAVEGLSDSDAIAAFRNMFVTINNEAKRVSGHFITLLKDRSLAAITIRQLAQEWKDNSEDALQSYLQMLEWNERHDALANQRRRSFSCTSVGILNMALTRLFYRSLHARQVLNLAEIRTDLESGDEYVPYTKIYEDNFDLAQLPTLRAQIKVTLVPALSVLFQEADPYKDQWSRYQEALTFLEGQVRQGKRGYVAYRDDVLRKFRLANVLDDESVRLAEERFEEQVNIPDEQEIFFKNVFQQGMIRVWSDIHARVSAITEIDHRTSARAVVEALNWFCFSDTNLFERDRIYVRYTLYHDGGKPQVSDVGKNAWKAYIGASMLSEGAFGALIETVKAGIEEQSDEVTEDIRAYLREQVEEYMDELKRRTESFVRKNWEFGPFEQQKRDELLELRAAAQRDDDAADRFDMHLNELAEEYYLDARRKCLTALRLHSKFE